VTDYSIRPATLADIHHIVQHRAEMFRDMGIAADFDAMAAQRSGTTDDEETDSRSRLALQSASEAA
jgi:hypothetical protein